MTNRLIPVYFISFLFMVSTNSYAQLQEQTVKDENNISATLIEKHESIKLRILRLETDINKIKDVIEANQADLREIKLMIDGLEDRITDRTLESKVRKQLRKQLEGYKEKITPQETLLNLLEIQLTYKNKEFEEALKEKDDLESKHPFLLEQKAVEGPALHGIEVINIQNGAHHIELAPMEKVKLRAIPHSYDKEGNDVGNKVANFNPTWSTKYGIFIPETGPEVTYVLTNVANVVQFFIQVSQENAEGKIIKTDVSVHVIRDEQ